MIICFTGEEKMPEYLKNAWLAQRFKRKKKELKEMLSIRVGQEALAELEKASTLVEDSMEKESPDPRLLERIRQAKEKKERKTLICEAYTAGHSQHKIAEVLGISQSAVHGIIRRSRRK
ncbi:sigma factor-like helix-turn-helix DNA-binding protein [Hydrogenimonas sp.]